MGNQPASPSQYWVITESEQAELDTEDIGPAKDHIVRSKKNGKYYFIDETGRDLFGPYDTAEQAKEGCAKYCEML